MNGIVITKTNDIQLPWRTASSFVDSGYIHIHKNSYEEHLAHHQNLRRKLNKFNNKGGKIEVLHGVLRADILKELTICLSDSEQHAKANLGFQDIYNPLAMSNLAAPHLNTVHFIASMGHEIIGYHSFLRSGETLHCLSGGFKRNTQSNYHAYENIIMESIRYAMINNFEHIHYGPVFNRTKALMMQNFAKTELNFYSRHAWLRKGIPFIIHKSRINPKLLNEFIDIR